MKKINYSLYLCTDRNLMSTQTVEESAELAIKGGCTVIQLREKEVSGNLFYKTACNLKKITNQYNIPLIINDRIDIALAVNADGVHVGQEDIPASTARKLIGRDKILGVSASNLKQALEAEDAGADYLGVGAMFATGTKTDADTVTIEELLKIRNAVNIPIVIIGGINKNTIEYFKNSGIDGIAVVSAIIAQKNITAAAAELLELFKGISL